MYKSAGHHQQAPKSHRQGAGAAAKNQLNSRTGLHELCGDYALCSQIACMPLYLPLALGAGAFLAGRFAGLAAAAGFLMGGGGRGGGGLGGGGSGGF
jgi:hypothetical protein